MSDKTFTRPAVPADSAAIGALHARVFGPGRFARTAYRVREAGRRSDAFTPFCRVALRAERVIASVKFSAVSVGGQPGVVLLGPVAVDPEFAGQGYGRQLVSESLETARAAGCKLALLVGDLPYYGRFGFAPVPPGQITLPGPVNPARLLALPLEDGALQRFAGPVASA